MFCSTFLSVFEIPYRAHDVAGGNTIVGFWSSMWLSVITITSVGFGDFYPHSFFGKTLGVVMAVGGAFIISFLVPTVGLIF